MVDRRRGMQFTTRIAATLVIMAGITVFYFRIFTAAHTATIFLTFLWAIFAIAAAWGLFEAIIASLSAALCVAYFFLPPIGFRIVDPQHRIALVAFLVTAVVASQLSAGMKKKSGKWLQRQKEMERLYELSQDFMKLGGRSPEIAYVSHRIAEVFELPAVAIFDRQRDEVHRFGELAIPNNRLRDGALQETTFQDTGANAWLVPLSLDGKVVGSLAISGRPISDATLSSIGKLAAIAMQRGRAEPAPITRPVEHERRKPEPITGDEEPQEFQESNLILQKSPTCIPVLIECVLQKLNHGFQGRVIRTDFSPNLPEVLVDTDLAAVTLRQLIATAFRYSDPETPITIQASLTGQSVKVGVKYRGTSGKPSAIARDIVLAHGGAMWDHTAPAQSCGLFFTLPVARQATD